jgi:outer membrane lipoprotein-sorting protein
MMGVEVDTETITSDYKKIDGVMVAFSITSYQDGEEFMTMIIDEVKFNTGIEDSFFMKEE